MLRSGITPISNRVNSTTQEGSVDHLTLLLTNYHLAEGLRSEQFGNLSGLERRLNPVCRDLRHIGFHLFKSCVGDNSTLLKLFFGKLAAGFLNGLTAGDLHFKLPLEAENDVEKVDRLGV